MNYRKTSTHLCVAPGAGLEPAYETSTPARNRSTSILNCSQRYKSISIFPKINVFLAHYFTTHEEAYPGRKQHIRKPLKTNRYHFFQKYGFLKTTFSKLMHSRRRQPDRSSIRQNSHKTSPLHPRPTTSHSMPRIFPRNAPNFNYLPPSSINPHPITKSPKISPKCPENQTPL